MSRILVIVSSVLALGVALLLYRRLVVVGGKAKQVSLAGKTIVVTGASPGSIGVEAARILASWGARVIVTTRRDPAAAARIVLEGAPGVTADRVAAHSLDLCDPDSVRAFVAWYRETIGERLDVLVNCAGVHLDLVAEWKAPKTTSDGFEIHYRTNYLGTVHLTELFMPLLTRTAKEAGEARVVNVVSHLHTMSKNEEMLEAPGVYHSWRAYGRSKLALMHETAELERRFGGEGVHAFSLHPGSVLSKVADKGLEEKPLLGAIRKALSPIEAFFLKTTNEGAQTIVHCASAPGLAGGRYFEECAVKDVPALEDRGIAAALYAKTHAWVDALAR